MAGLQLVACFQQGCDFVIGIVHLLLAPGIHVHLSSLFVNLPIYPCPEDLVQVHRKRYTVVALELRMVKVVVVRPCYRLIHARMASYWGDVCMELGVQEVERMN